MCIGSVPTNAATSYPTLLEARRTSIQDEGNACFDMADAIPGLKTSDGKR